MVCFFFFIRLFLLGIVFSGLLTAKSFAQNRPQSYLFSDSTSTQVVALPESLRANGQKRDKTQGEILSELQNSTTDPIVLNNIAAYYASEGRWNEALPVSRRSVSVDGALTATRMNLALIYDHLGQREQALEQAAKAAAIDPKYERARFYECRLNLFLGRDRNAADCYRKVNREFQTDLKLKLEFAVALVKSGQLTEAKSVVDKLTPEQQKLIDTLNILANIYFRLKEFDKAPQF